MEFLFQNIILFPFESVNVSQAFLVDWILIQWHFFEEVASFISHWVTSALLLWARLTGIMEILLIEWTVNFFKLTESARSFVKTEKVIIYLPRVLSSSTTSFDCKRISVWCLMRWYPIHHALFFYWLLLLKIKIL